MDIVDTGHPGVSVLNAEQAPCEGALDNGIQPAAGGKAGTVTRDFGGPIAALRIVPQSTASVVPFGQESILLDEALRISRRRNLGSSVPFSVQNSVPPDWLKQFHLWAQPFLVGGAPPKGDSDYGAIQLEPSDNPGWG